jgi:predicted transcriptional regulator
VKPKLGISDVSSSFRDLIKNNFTYKENGEERKITDEEIDELERMLEIMKKMDGGK